jgi:SAM-dependent methyltransferase
MSESTQPLIRSESKFQAAIRRRLAFLRCPDCLSGTLSLSSSLSCVVCNRIFDTDGGAVEMVPRATTKVRTQIETFWGDVYLQWYSRADSMLTTETLLQEIPLLQDLFRVRRHLPGREVRLEELAGREMLEIGSGAGGHSALFRSYGAHVTAVDITPERVFATGRKLQLLEGCHPGDGLAIRAEAEKLPFANESFSLIYSNGVLHHATDTVRAVCEAKRVLRHGGSLALMLYSRHSALYWLRLLPLGLLSGKAFRLPEAEWLGYLTEGRPKFFGARNPITRVYSAAQIRHLLDGFDNIVLRKFSFTFGHLPIPGAEGLRTRLLSLLGYPPHDGGRLVYGNAVVPETPLELALGSLCGYAWAITARKS